MVMTIRSACASLTELSAELFSQGVENTTVVGDGGIRMDLSMYMYGTE